MKSFDMKKTREAVVVVTLALGLGAVAAPAYAGKLVTPPLSRGAAANDYNCRVTNIAPQSAKNVEMTIRDGGGNVDEYQWKGTVSSMQSRGMLSFEDPASIAYCEVQGSGISASKSRVTLCVRDWNNTPIECVTAP